MTALRRYPNMFEFFSLATGLAGLNSMICAALMFRWYGPLVIGLTASMVAAVSVLMALVTLPLAWLLNRVIHRRAFGFTCGSMVLASVLLTILISKQPSASRLFEQEFGFPPDGAVSKLEGFTSQVELQDPTVGLKFQASAAIVEKIVTMLKLESVGQRGPHWGPVLDRAHELNPVPEWFDPDELNLPESWQGRPSGRPVAYELYHEPEKGLVYFLARHL